MLGSIDPPTGVGGVRLADLERQAILETLRQNAGNQTKAARYLDTSLRIVNYKIHNYGIDPKQFKVK